ncbi:hypothetical protein DB347_07890 [Opitutaceae bacterium EW11]|nr:hypothetical protein DB347_07890 [Opitutaceae bacterium EW11]
MKKLSPRELELVSLGAALGSNCVPCIEYHVPAARRAGLTDEEIAEAIRQADKVRQVPANKVLATAEALLRPSEGCGCGSAGASSDSRASSTSTDNAAGCCG